MFFIHNIWRDINRHKMKYLINLCVCIMVVVLLNIYVGSLNSNEMQLNDLAEVIPIYGRVCNLNGSQETGLEIKEETIQSIEQSPYLEDQVYSMQLAGAEGEFPKEDWKQYLNIPIQATNTVNGIYGANQESIELDRSISADFLESDQPYLLVDETAMELSDWKVGDKVLLTIYYYAASQYGTIDWQYCLTEEFCIAGTMKIVYHEESVMPMSAVVPYGWAEAAMSERQISYLADSVSFKLKDAEELNAFKKEMKAGMFMEVVPTAEQSLAGIAMTMDDETYINSATRLMKNIKLFQSLWPLVLIIVMGVGFTVSYILVQNQQREYVLMRTLGVSRGGCFMQFFMEYLTVGIMGGIIGAGISAALVDAFWTIRLMIIGVFMVCYMCGAALALCFLGKGAVMAALARKE